MIQKKQNKRKIFSIFATFLMMFSLITPGFAAAESSNKISQSVVGAQTNAKDKVSDRLLSEFEDNEKVTFLVKFKEKSDPMKIANEAKKNAESKKITAQQAKFQQRSAVLADLKSVALESQYNVIEYLEDETKSGNVEDFEAFHIVNGMAVTATKAVAEKIAAFTEVEKILPNEERQLHEATVKTDEPAPKSSLTNVEWSVERVKAPEAWALGIDGKGTVVASLDTGVQWNHPALKGKYRGFDTNEESVDHQYSWFDAVGGQSNPLDDHGHGTHVTGTMVGAEPNGTNQIGVAPGAKWIAAKVFDSVGNTTDAVLLSAAQWIIAPGGDVNMAPDVVNNSWGGGPGLDEWYRDAVNAWRASEIFPEFSAGNTTPNNSGGPGSVAVPANYPESFATGAVDANNQVPGFSLRGPSPYGDIKPDITAPGVNIRSSVPGSGYEGGWNGTSMSGPAVAGVAALLRQVNADISVEQMEQILLSTTTPLTDSEYPSSPNHGYGYGLVDAYEAVSAIMADSGIVKGHVTEGGEDEEPPTFDHTPITEKYVGMDIELLAQVQDNISVTSVELHYEVDGGDTQVVKAPRVSGDHKDGEYRAQISGENMEGDLLTYKWVINDFGNNEVVSEAYEVTIKSAITPEYEENFDEKPFGWQSSGENDAWDWGVPTTGPGSAYSGENVYATNTSWNYPNNMNAILQMPPVQLPEDESLFLEFSHWYSFEDSPGSMKIFDIGHVVISTDQKEWTELLTARGDSKDWIHEEIDLSDYAGQRVYIGFRAKSDHLFSREGWYIDQVGLYDSSRYDNDEEKPTVNFTQPKEAYSDRNLDFIIDAEDNTRIKSVKVSYLNENEDWTTIEGELQSGNYRVGRFKASIPEEAIVGESLTYRVTVEDYGNNSAVSDDYVVLVKDYVTVGYFEDLQTRPDGWYSTGANDTWDWGVPKSGPESAYSGENVYATNLGGHYDSLMDATLMMPPMELPEDDTLLFEFTHWYSLEGNYENGKSYDFGHVVVSTDGEEWTRLATFTGDSEGWFHEQIDLSDYSGQRVYIGFHTTSDDGYMFHRDGWYIDQVALYDSTRDEDKDAPAFNQEAKNQADQGVDPRSNKKDKALHEVDKQEKKSTPVKLKEETVTMDESFIASNKLPLAATINVLESGSTVKSSPVDGSYLLYHNTGTFTVEASAYGFKPEQQKTTIADGEETIADFELEELGEGTVTGQVTNQDTGTAISGATLLLIEDANIQPVETDESGNFTLSAYEGTYTLKVVAQNFHSQEVEITIGSDPIEINLELDPYYTYSGGEIGYDDGSAENATAYNDAGNGWGVKMSLPEEEEFGIVTDGVFRFWDTRFPDPGGTEFEVEVWDVGSNGMPGKKLAGPIEGTALRDGTWTTVNLRDHNIVVDGDFYMVYIQTTAGGFAPGLATDEDGPNAKRSYEFVNDSWSPVPVEEGNYMIRANVDYEVATPMITTPEASYITNEENITIEGSASPTTSIQLTNNGEEVGTAAIEDNGLFSFTTDLTEGDNKFIATTLIDDDAVLSSETVTVTLDSKAPSLTIDSPSDGDVINTNTVVVEGTASDDHLDYIDVNGEKVVVEDGNYSKRIIVEEGTNELTVTAYDLAGNSETKTVTITVNSEAPVIENLQPSKDQYVVPGDEVEISFSSESEGGTAGFVINLPVLNSTQSTVNKMEEVEPGEYKGTWTVPANTNLEGAVIQVDLTDAAGNKVTKEAAGKLYISQDQLDRISGEDRYLTAIETSKKSWAKSDAVVIARGDDFADALSGVPLAYQLNAPVLLTLSDKLYEETLNEVKRLGAKKVIILGGSSAISDSVTEELEKAGLKVERIAGANRFDTAAKIASEVAPNGADKVVVANGMDFPDALSVASHAAKEGLPILLTETNKLSIETKAAIKSLKASQTIVVGGTTVVSAKVAKELPKATRLAGADRYDTNIAIAKHFGVDSKHLYVATGKNYADALTGAVLAAKNDSAVLLVHDRVPEVVTTYVTTQNIKRLTIFGGDSAVSSKVSSELEKLIK